MATKVQLTLKKKPIWPATSIDNLFDPVTGQKADLSKIIAVTDYKINNKAAVNGNFTVTAQDVGAATADHTHSASEVGAASINHHHEIQDVNGLEARLLGIGQGEPVEGGFAITPLNNSSYPEPSSWTSSQGA